jgi:hypothetical protein
MGPKEPFAALTVAVMPGLRPTPSRRHKIRARTRLSAPFSINPPTLRANHCEQRPSAIH